MHLLHNRLFLFCCFLALTACATIEPQESPPESPPAAPPAIGKSMAGGAAGGDSGGDSCGSIVAQAVSARKQQKRNSLLWSKCIASLNHTGRAASTAERNAAAPR